MRRVLGTFVLVVAFLTPTQIVSATEQVPYKPFVERMMQTEMKMGEVMMKLMKAKKMKMSPAMRSKLMRMLDELDELLEDLGSSEL